MIRRVCEGQSLRVLALLSFETSGSDRSLVLMFSSALLDGRSGAGGDATPPATGRTLESMRFLRLDGRRSWWDTNCGPSLPAGSTPLGFPDEVDVFEKLNALRGETGVASLLQELVFLTLLNGEKRMNEQKS